MEDIKVYHSLWKNAILVTLSLAFAAIGSFLLIHRPEDNPIIVWTCVIFFGFCGLFMLWLIVKERITHTPYYVITDDRIIVNGGVKVWEVRFADVEQFFIMRISTRRGSSVKLIGIRYKRDVEQAKFEESGSVSRFVRKMNVMLAGSSEGLPAESLTLRPQQLCDLLNERLRAYGKRR